MNKTMSKPSKSKAISDFFLLSKVGFPIFLVMTMLVVGVIPAIFICWAQSL